MRNGLLVLAIALAAATPVSAADWVAVPLPPGGWALLLVEVYEETIVRVVSETAGGAVALALAYAHETGSRRGFPTIHSDTSDTFALTVDGAEHETTIARSSPKGAGSGVILQPGVYDVVVIAGGREPVSAEYFVNSGGNSFQEIRRGNESVYLYADDFERGIGSEARLNGFSARGAAQLSHTLSVGSNFLGFFDLTIQTQPTLSRATQGETVHECPCRFYNIGEGLGPGEWEFTISGASASFTTPLLFGADIRMS